MLVKEIIFSASVDIFILSAGTKLLFRDSLIIPFLEYILYKSGNIDNILINAKILIR
jgi:hypothetical protein